MVYILILNISNQPHTLDANIRVEFSVTMADRSFGSCLGKTLLMRLDLPIKVYVESP